MVKSADDPYDLLAYPDQAISIVHESPAGFEEDDRWLLSPEGLQFPKSMLSGKLWLLITGYQPFLMSGIKDGQSISLQPSFRSNLSFEKVDWPEEVRYDLNFVPIGGEETLASAQMKLVHRVEDWDVKRYPLFFPAAGGYILEWHLVEQDRLIDEPIHLWSMVDGFIHLDPKFPNRTLDISIPGALLAKAKEMTPAILQARAEMPTQVIEMEAVMLPRRENE
ncbi:MAG: hypothetical protein H8E15_16960 [Planctomycetes bacterium]|nr:hypothetical protein [Planctomycetota bacterium]